MQPQTFLIFELSVGVPFEPVKSSISLPVNYTNYCKSENALFVFEKTQLSCETRPSCFVTFGCDLHEYTILI